MARLSIQLGSIIGVRFVDDRVVICDVRVLASEGKIPGVVKSSW